MKTILRVPLGLGLFLFFLAVTIFVNALEAYQRNKLGERYEGPLED